MTLTVQLVWGRVQRPWGYEVRVDYTDGNRTFNEELCFQSEPTQQQLESAIAGRKTRLELVETPPEPQYSITNDDGTTTLI